MTLSPCRRVAGVQRHDVGGSANQQSYLPVELVFVASARGTEQRQRVIVSIICPIYNKISSCSGDKVCTIPTDCGQTDGLTRGSSCIQQWRIRDSLLRG